jgi:myosin-crossreactive antigen
LKTTIQQSVDFSNVQAFDITSAAYVQDIEQVTSIETTTTQQTAKTTLVNTEQARYPLTVDINVVLNSNGTENQTTTVRQENYDNTSQLDNGVETSWQLLDNLENSTDDLEISGAGSIIGNSGQLSSQQYTLYNSTGYCYDETLTAASNKLTSFGNGCQ